MIATYVRFLSEELKTTEGHRVHDGILAALAAAEARERCAIGLGTGNVREGAEAKLTPVALHHRFSFGGFGSDHEDRAELIRIGIARGAEKLGLGANDVRAVVIGDTPKDVAAAHANHAFALAVATGGFTEGELRASGAGFHRRQSHSRGVARGAARVGLVPKPDASELWQPQLATQKVAQRPPMGLPLPVGLRGERLTTFASA